METNMKTFFISLAVTVALLMPIKIEVQEVSAVPTKPLSQVLSAKTPVKELVYQENYLTELECLQKNIYFEAAVESTAGKLAVAHVTSNRVKSTKYPNSYCDVVHEGKHYPSGFPMRDRCQFSWYCDGKHDTPYPGPTWKKTQQLAEYYMKHKHLFKDITDGATHYHADYIDSPRWSKFLEKTVKIDTHIFYR